MKKEERVLTDELRNQESMRKEQMRKKTLQKIRKRSTEVKERNRFTEELEERPQVQQVQHEQIQPIQVQPVQAQKNSPVKKPLNKKNVEKLPKWARTEDQIEEDFEEDVDKLLEFTNNLDFEDFINDIEVKTALKSVKKRVDDLKKEETDKRRVEKLEKMRARENDAREVRMSMGDDLNNRDELASH